MATFSPNSRTVASQCDGTVWLVGGGNLAEQFRGAGLIDEYLIFIIPVILGRGIPLFGGDAPHTALDLIGSQTYGDGGVMLRYGPRVPPDSGFRGNDGCREG